MNGYDTVFANAKDEEIEFETMFDQEDDLIDTIVGCNENGDPLTGAEPCPAATAEERSTSDENPDYEKDVDADDSKNVPNDAEGTVGYDFETKPEIDGKVDDQSVPEAEPVEGEPEYQKTNDSDKGVEDTVTGTIDNNDDVLESYFKEAEDELGYEETDTEEERLTDAPEVTPEDIEDTAKKVAKENDATDAEEVVNNSDKGVEDTVTGTIDNNDDVLESYFKEAEDELNGADTDSSKNAAERSCDDCNPDYEKDIDADDTKGAPKDAEGTVGYDFETNPEMSGKVDDQSTVDSDEVKVEEEVEFDTTIPKDTEGTVGYDFEVNPEIGAKDDQSTVDSDEVKVEEEVDYDGIDPEAPPEGSEKTSPAGPTNIVDDCGDGKCESKCESVGYDFEEAATSDDIEEIEKVDKDVEDIEDTEGYIDDDAIEDAESKDPNVNLDYDFSDEEVIDYVMNNN